MSSSKPPGGRFGLLFGIKRRPSTNFQQVQEPSPTSQQHFSLELSTDGDPFKANGPSILSPRAISGPGTVHYPPDFEIASNALGASSSSPSASDSWLTATEEQPTMQSAKNDQRRAGNPAELFSLSSNGLPAVRTTLSGNHDTNRRDLRVATSTADTASRLTIRHDSAATSAESLALAAAIAHANGLVLQPSPSLVRTSSSGIGYPPPADEYPSPPPSRRGSAAHTVDHFDDSMQVEEGESRRKGRTPALSIDILTVATGGSSSLPTTPALIDSFPATPHTNVPSCPPTSPMPSPSVAASPMHGLPIRGGRQRASSAADAWTSPMVPSARIYKPDLDEVWGVAEKERVDKVRYNYPLPKPGPPPSAPLPPEPLSPRLHSSALHKHMQQLELEFNSLTRKLSPISPLSTASQSLSTASSPIDIGKLLKKYPSRSKLRRESSSGISGSSGASSNRILPSSVSTSSATLPLSDSPFTSTEQSLSSHQSSTQSPRQASSLSQQFCMDSNSPKAKDKDKKSAKEKDSAKGKEDRDKDKDKDSFSKRKFFSKYASIYSLDKETTKAITVNTDVEDVAPMRSIQGGVTGFMDEELGANLSLAVSSAQKTQESCMALLSISPPDSQRSPSDDRSSLRSIPLPQTPTRPVASQSEYPHQHILPPAELLRLERVGFTAQDQVGRRGRDPSLSLSPISPLGTSPLNSLPDWSQRSTSTNTSRADVIPPSTSPLTRTRPYRSGSLAAMSSSSSTLLSTQSPIRENPLASRSFAALPRTVDTVSQRRPSNASSLTPARRPMSSRSLTTPSSPVTGHSPLSPPPRPRNRSLKSGNGIGDPEPESTETHFTALSPPPRSSRRPSTASSSMSATQRQSTLRKPSFLDIEDDDGRPSLEEATVASAPGLNNSDSRSTSSLTPSPSIRTLNALGGGRSSSSLSISTTSRQVQMSANSSNMEDSFLDMGKASLETIRSESSDTHAFQGLEQSPLQQHTTYLESLQYRSPLGSHYQRGNIIGSNY